MRLALFISWLGFALCAQAATQPNIVFFLIDDLGYADCGFNGGKEIKTPNIDRLAQVRHMRQVLRSVSGHQLMK